MNGGEGTRNIRSCNRARGIIYSSPTPSILQDKLSPQHPKHEPSRRYLLFLPHPLHFYRPWGPETSESSTEQAVLVPFLGGGWGSSGRWWKQQRRFAAASEAAALAMALVLQRLG
jgi:hypothetical protein